MNGAGDGKRTRDLCLAKTDNLLRWVLHPPQKVPINKGVLNIKIKFAPIVNKVVGAIWSKHIIFNEKSPLNMPKMASFCVFWTKWNSAFFTKRTFYTNLIKFHKMCECVNDWHTNNKKIFKSQKKYTLEHKSLCKCPCKVPVNFSKWHCKWYSKHQKWYCKYLSQILYSFCDK